MYKELSRCSICPRHCHVNRNNHEVGLCKVGNKLKIAKADLHFWEEPPISGTRGSGTIFFTGCNLRCAFCQNYDISTNNIGKEVSISRFADICLELQARKAHNINLVTPTVYIPLIIDGLKLAKKRGLKIPIIYNTSGYENVDQIKKLNGLIDIYLPDFKYYDNAVATKYSMAPNYKEVTTIAIDEMFHQVGEPKYDKKGIMKKGVIVRHLLLPTHLEDSKKVMDYLYDIYHNKVCVSIMNQYTVTRQLPFTELNQKVTDDDYDELINYACVIGITNAFMQESETADECFIPDFDCKGV